MRQEKVRVEGRILFDRIKSGPLDLDIYYFFCMKLS